MATIDQILQQASARGFTDKQMADARQAYYNGGKDALSASLQSSVKANPTAQTTVVNNATTENTNNNANGQTGPVTTNLNTSPVQTTTIPSQPTPTPASPGEGTMSTGTQQATSDIITQATNANVSEQQALQNLQDQQKKALETTGQLTKEGIASETQYAKDTQALLDEYQKHIQQLASDQERTAREKAQRDTEIIKSQQLADAEVGRASLAKQQLLEQENNEDAKKVAESNQILAMTNLQKMGAFGTGSAITTMTNVVNEGTKLIADAKVAGAYQTATLKKDLNQAQLQYTTAINEIIDDTENNINAIKTELVNDIYKIQNNKLLSEKQKDDKILALKKSYINQESQYYADSYSRVQKQNEVIGTRLNKIQDAQSINEAFYAERITNDISSGTWITYTPEQKEKLARSAGLTVDQINNNIKATVNKAIDAGVKSIMGTAYVINSSTFAEIQSLAQQKANLGIDYQAAVTQAIQEVIPNTQDYKDMQEAKKAKTNLENMKIQAEINKSKAETSKAYADIEQTGYENAKIMAEAGKTQAETSAKLAETQDTYGTGANTYKITGAKNSNLLNASPGSLIPTTKNYSYVGQNKNGGMECAEYVSYILGRKVGNTYQQKLSTNAIPTNEAGVGDVAVWMPKGAPKAYGHAGLIIGESGDNWIIKSSNLKGDGKISIDTIPKTTIKGYQGTNLQQESVSSKQSSQNIISKYGVTNTEAIKQIDKMTKAGNLSGAEDYAKNIQKVEKDKGVIQLAPIYNNILKTVTTPQGVFEELGRQSGKGSVKDVADLMLVQGLVSSRENAISKAGASAKSLGKTKWAFFKDGGGIKAVYVKPDGSIDGEATILESNN